jgi:hypothetical protein
MTAQRKRSKSGRRSGSDGKATVPALESQPDGLGLLRLAALLQPIAGDGVAPAALPTAAQLERAMRTVGMADFAPVAAGWSRCYRPTRIP